VEQQKKQHQIAILGFGWRSALKEPFALLLQISAALSPPLPPQLQKQLNLYFMLLSGRRKVLHLFWL
jgi:hypothetical protein